MNIVSIQIFPVLFINAGLLKSLNIEYANNFWGPKLGSLLRKEGKIMVTTDSNDRSSKYVHT